MLHLPAAAAVAARLEVLPATGSTNADLVRAATADPAAWPPGSVLVTDDQTAGRGRLGRTWTAASGDALAVSVLLAPAVAPARLGWLSLAAGAAMTRALRSSGVAAAAKWPNDVLVAGRKVAGVLGEALPGGGAVVGIGVNHRAAPAGVPTATSLAAEGGPTDPDVLVAAYLGELLALSAAFGAAGGDPDRGLRTAVLDASGTVGHRVRVLLPDGGAITGTAVDIDREGRVVVDRGRIGGIVGVAAGDVEHLRYE